MTKLVHPYSEDGGHNWQRMDEISRKPWVESICLHAGCKAWKRELVWYSPDGAIDTPANVDVLQEYRPAHA